MLSGLCEYPKSYSFAASRPGASGEGFSAYVFQCFSIFNRYSLLAPGALQGPANKDRHAIFQPLTRSKTRLVKTVEFLATELSDLPSRERSFHAIHPAQPEPAQSRQCTQIRRYRRSDLLFAFNHVLFS